MTAHRVSLPPPAASRCCCWSCCCWGHSIPSRALGQAGTAAHARAARRLLQYHPRRHRHRCLRGVTDGPDGAEAVIEVSRYRSDLRRHGCPQVLLHAFNRVPLAAGALQMSGELETVTVQGPARCPSAACCPGSAPWLLDLTWTGVGPVVSDAHEEGERFRRARAAGTLRAGTTNFTPAISRRCLHRGVVSARALTRNPSGRDLPGLG